MKFILAVKVVYSSYLSAVDVTVDLDAKCDSLPHFKLKTDIVVSF